MLCSCGHTSSHYSIRPAAQFGDLPRTICRNCAYPRPRVTVTNPYAGLVLEHATDELGQPIRVNSLRQMREAESRYHFRSLVANERSCDFDKPPQLRPRDLFEQTTETGGWLYPEIAEEMVRELRETGEIGPAS